MVQASVAPPTTPALVPVNPRNEGFSVGDEVLKTSNPQKQDQVLIPILLPKAANGVRNEGGDCLVGVAQQAQCPRRIPQV